MPGHYSRRVAPFGNPRIKRSLAATRGLSQQRYVLHRLLVPRHPPHALSSLTFYRHCSMTEGLQKTRIDLRSTFVKSNSPACSTLPGKKRDSHAASQTSIRVVNVPAAVTTTAVSDHEMWRRPGSNRRPPACKAGALPAELRPHADEWGDRPSQVRRRAWAFLDSNQRPHGYQPCALTN